MSEELKLRGRELEKALGRCCGVEDRECAGCFLEKMPGTTQECMTALIGAALAEISELRAATEEYAGELVERMVTLAREGNTAGARGLEKVSGDMIFELNSIQARLTELGRESVVRAEPVAGQGWRVTLIQVEGREVFNGEEAAQDG